MLFKKCFRIVLNAGRAVTDGGREITQICSAEKQKARPPYCFRLKVGMRKVLSSEEERRDLEET